VGFVDWRSGNSRTGVKMKKIICVIAIIALNIGVVSANIITNAGAMVADAEVRGGTYADAALGTSAFFRVRTSTTADSQHKAYLKVDTSSILSAGNIFSNAALTLTAQSLNANGTTTLSLYGIIDNNDSWTENAVTWNNAPKNDTTSGSGVLSGTALLATITINPGTFTSLSKWTFSDSRISEYLNWTEGAIADPYGNGSSSDHLATFIIAASGADANNRLYQFYSRDDSGMTTKPFISYQVIPEPTTIGMFGVAGFIVLIFRRLVY
jgi:hypothetical protein